MDKKCNFCGNTSYKNKSVDYFYRNNDNYFIVNDVPCEECDYCGEQYFEASVLKKIEKEFKEIYSLNKKVVNEIRVPSENYMEL